MRAEESLHRQACPIDGHFSSFRLHNYVGFHRRASLFRSGTQVGRSGVICDEPFQALRPARHCRAAVQAQLRVGCQHVRPRSVLLFHTRRFETVLDPGLQGGACISASHISCRVVHQADSGTVCRVERLSPKAASKPHVPQAIASSDVHPDCSSSASEWQGRIAQPQGPWASCASHSEAAVVVGTCT